MPNKAFVDFIVVLLSWRWLVSEARTKRSMG